MDPTDSEFEEMTEDQEEEEEEEEPEEAYDQGTPKNYFLYMGFVAPSLSIALKQLNDAYMGLCWHSFSHAGLIYHLNAAIMRKMFPEYSFAPTPRFFKEALGSPRVERRNSFCVRLIPSAHTTSHWKPKRDWSFAERSRYSGFHYGHNVDLLCELVGILRNFPFAMSEIPELVLELLKAARTLGYPISEYKGRERLHSKEWIASCQYQNRPAYREEDVDDTDPMPDVGELQFACEEQPYPEAIGRALVYKMDVSEMISGRGHGCDQQMRAFLHKPLMFMAEKGGNDSEGRNRVLQQSRDLEVQIIHLLTDRPFQEEYSQMWFQNTILST